MFQKIITDTSDANMIKKFGGPSELVAEIKEFHKQKMKEIENCLFGGIKESTVTGISCDCPNCSPLCLPCMGEIV